MSVRGNGAYIKLFLFWIQANNFVPVVYLHYGTTRREYTTRAHHVESMMEGSDRMLTILDLELRSTALLRFIPLSIGDMQNGDAAEDKPIIPPKVGYIYDTRMMQHECIPNFHPEQPLRISSIFEKLEEAGCIRRMVQIPCREALQEEVTLVHTQKLWDTVEEFQSVFYLFASHHLLIEVATRHVG